MTATVRFARAGLPALLVAAMLLVLAGCAQADKPTGADVPEGSNAKAAAVRIGTLPTEDSLPLWVAEKMGYFATQGVESVEIITFQSAQERDAAFASGSIDAFMGDIIAAANLEAGGAPNTIKTIMLGADPSQGRFAVVVPPNSQVTSVAQLKGVPVGTSSATIQEYVLDGLMKAVGVSDAEVKKEEIKKVPVRFELLMADKIKAAALPEPFVTLAEQGGAKVVADDTQSQENLTQTVLVFADGYLATPEGASAADAVLGAWDVAAQQINQSPDSYRQDLVDKARLPQPLVETYQVNTYPMAGPPSQADVNAVLDWMRTKDYLKGDVSYDDLVSDGN